MKRIHAAPVKGIEVATHLAHDLVSIKILLAPIDGITPPDHTYSLSLHLAGQLRDSLEHALEHLRREDEKLRRGPAM